MVVPQEGQTTSVKHLGGKEGRVKKPPVEEGYETGPRWNEADTHKSIYEFENVAEYIYRGVGPPPVYEACILRTR